MSSRNGRVLLNVKLDIHHRSNPFGGLLSKPVPFSTHKIWWTIHRSDCENWKHITYGQPYPLRYCASSSPPLFKNWSPRPDFPRMTTIHSFLPFCGFRFCKRGLIPQTDYRISVLCSNARKKYQTE
ncbi:hypothetical protein AVEN_243214-1 [Araneus ventricosus]|uniref:Uncharacterized protein n=1 Tax=Araneus ventricosus TaxID=182803 RepID=A0A4Y2IT95_ARAVE|nr:hypothetical protein AVEN_243214-1 [Araneus ventricosus]